MSPSSHDRTSTVDRVVTDSNATGSTENVAVVVPEQMTPASRAVRPDPRQWWKTHDEGTNGRPKPGTRVVVGAHHGTVDYYEGLWHSHSFPVRFDHTPVVGHLSTDHNGRPFEWCYEGEDT